MDRPAFDALVEQLSPYLQQRKRARSDSIEPAERVYLALMWLGGGGAFNRLEAQTGRGATTISKSLHMVCEAICECLAGEVRLPNIGELRTSAELFRDKTGMHGCYGALDGKMFRFVCPESQRLACHNYKGFQSLNVLVYCDFGLQCRWMSDFFVGKTVSNVTNVTSHLTMMAELGEAVL